MLSGTGVLLLSAVAGYWVLERASAHKGNLKRVGQLVGSAIIIISLLGVACRTWALATGKGMHCPHGKAAWCPFSPSSGPSSPIK